MHEYGITKNVISMVEHEAKENNANKVKSITLVVGDLSSIIDESVQMYFDILAKDTLCEGAGLVFNRVKAQLQCRNCGQYFERYKSSFDCPYCGGVGKLTDIGKEFYIESIEVE